MGWVSAIGSCILCKRIFSFNPHKVPSTSILTGNKEPVCPRCMAEINDKRKEQGLEPFFIHPDAYEAIPEEEL